MLLLMMREWFGPGRRMSVDERLAFAVEEKLRGFVTSLPLGTALLRIKQYSDTYKATYRFAVEYSLLGVYAIDDLTQVQIQAADVRHVETLEQTGEDFANS